MRELITVKHCKTKMIREASCYHSLLSFKRLRLSILFVTLIVTLLIFALGSQSAFSQCAGLCLYEQDTPQTKFPPEGLEAGYRKSATAYLGSEEVTEPNRDLSVSDVQGVSIKQNSGIFASERISVSQGLSDEFALNETDSNATASENSGGNVYAANNEGTNSNPHASDPKHWEFILGHYASRGPNLTKISTNF